MHMVEMKILFFMRQVLIYITFFEVCANILLLVKQCFPLLRIEHIYHMQLRCVIYSIYILYYSLTEFYCKQFSHNT